SVNVRVGDYKLDSSNFVTDESFRGFIGSTGQVGIDRDYNSLRQDLWLATDQAYKEALDTLSRKRGFLRSLAKPPDIDDFSRAQPVKLIEPRLEPDWTSRNWEDEAKAISAVLRGDPQLYDTRVTYHLIYATSYLINTEGAEIRVSRSLAAIEASLETQADDGMPLHHFYAFYARRPSELPSVDVAHKELDRVGKELVALRLAPPAADYVGPVLFEAPAAGALVAQMLGPSVGGARPPLSMLPMFDQIMERMGGRSEWSGRVGTRVLPPSVTLVDDPGAKEFHGQPLMGDYGVDDEGVRGQRVTLVEDGLLRNQLMSRRPGPDFDQSNGHGRAAPLSDQRPAMSNLFFASRDTVSPAELRKRFLDKCREAGLRACLVVRQMDNPVLGLHRQEDLSDMIASLAAGAASGDRAPLLVFRVNVADGREELVRGARLTGLNLRALRSLSGIGNDAGVFSFMQSQATGFGGTALGAFGAAQGGVPSSMVAPSLLFEEVEVRGARGEPRRLPLVPPPPLN
ncbi:MAG TPA: metallopeptidase TldD-related protein, partial [Candidatus Acidoferrales bacterium]|nr:metallopeptidase TldD-related protein [Candidatus Acidoferrales bacterium]